MNDVQKVLDSINQLPGTIKTLTKDGVPVNVNATPATISGIGLYILGGLAVGGLLAGLVVGLLLRATKR